MRSWPAEQVWRPTARQTSANCAEHQRPDRRSRREVERPTQRPRVMWLGSCDFLAMHHAYQPAQARFGRLFAISTGNAHEDPRRPRHRCRIHVVFGMPNPQPPDPVVGRSIGLAATLPAIWSFDVALKDYSRRDCLCCTDSSASFSSRSASWPAFIRISGCGSYATRRCPRPTAHG